MPDIAMCKNKTCEQRNSCRRFTATPTPKWQSYAGFAPDAQGKCAGFWPNAATQIERWARRK